jgi:hypothetical protein
MSYHPYQLSMSVEQARKLAHGQRVKLTPEQIGHGSLFHLTKTQHTHLLHAKRSGAGAMITFSATQLQHHRVHGRGGFSDFLRSVKVHAVSGLKSAAKYGVEKGLDYAASAAKKHLPKELHQLAELAAKAGTEHIKKHIGSGLRAAGYGLRPAGYGLRAAGYGLKPAGY